MVRVRSLALVLALALVFGISISSAQNGFSQDIPYKIYLTDISYSSAPRWIGPFGGSVVALAGDPNNPDTVYAGSFGAGVFKSIDGGQHWVFASQDIAPQMIASLAVHPRDGNIVYAGTQGGGVYKSIDGGIRWFAVNQGIQNEAVVYTLTVNPGDPEIIYAGTRGIVATGGPPWNGVLYRSTNGGASWQAVLENIGGAQQEDWIYSIRVDPSNPNRVLAAAHEHGLFLADSYGGAGDWQPVGEVDGSGRAVAFDPRGWTSLAYYGTWHRTGVYRSLDGGSTWDQASEGLGEAKIYPNGIAISPADPDWVYLASFADPVHGVMRTTDRGETWARAGLNDYYVYGVYVPVGQSSTVFAGTAGLHGIFRTRDGGANWEKVINGLTHSNTSGFVIGPAGEWYAATRDRGVFRSSDAGQTWQEWNSGLGDWQVIGLVQSPADPSKIFALTASAGLRRLDLQNAVWQACSGLPAAVERQLSPGALMPGAPDQQLIDEMLGPTALEFQGGLSGTVLDMAFSPSSPATAYAATNGSGIYVSRDAGLTWSALAWSGRSIQAVAVHPHNASVMYAAADNGTRLLGSFDSGQSWPFDSAIPEGSIQAIKIMQNAPGAVYVAATSGLWQVQNSIWSRVALAGMPVHSLAEDPAAPQYVYAGTSNGLYRYHIGAGFASAASEAAGYTVARIIFPNNEPRVMYLATTTRGILRTTTP